MEEITSAVNQLYYLLPSFALYISPRNNNNPDTEYGDMVISSFSCENYPSWDHCDNDRRTKKTLVRERILNVAEKHVMKLPAPPRRQYYKWLCNTGMALSHSEA